VFGVGTAVSFLGTDLLPEGLRVRAGHPHPSDPWTAAGTPNTFLHAREPSYTTEVNTRGATNYVFPRRFQVQQFGDFDYDGSQEILAGYFKVEQPVTDVAEGAGRAAARGHGSAHGIDVEPRQHQLRSSNWTCCPPRAWCSRSVQHERAAELFADGGAADLPGVRRVRGLRSVRRRDRAREPEPHR
jgi:hypothetical protein